MSSRIPNPVNKLWFINRTLEGFEAKPEGMRRLPILRSIVFHYVALESIGELMGSPRQGEIFMPRSPLRTAYRLRHALLLVTVLAVGYTGYVAGNYGYGVGRQGADWLFGQLIPVPTVASTIPPASFAARVSPPPQNVWLVEEDVLGWLSRREIYNYIIDRFGQVYRIVSDDGVAVHAGASIWADEDYEYLNLNESFIGVAFESRGDAGREIVTPAQVQAALNLTDVLRSRHNIADQNCVPHGLVSCERHEKAHRLSRGLGPRISLWGSRPRRQVFTPASEHDRVRFHLR